MKRLYLFDVDGTILDSLAIIHQSMTNTFLEFGHAAPSEFETRSIIGLTLNLAIAQLLRRPLDDEAEHMTTRYKEIFNEIYNAPGFTQSMFDGMADIVDVLAKCDGVQLGMVTGKSRRGVDMFFTMHGLRACFGPIRTADDCPSKPHPAMVLECCAESGFNASDTFVIGDSVFDMRMANAAGARAIGVSWGYNTPAQLLEAGAQVIAEDAAHLLRILSE